MSSGEEPSCSGLPAQGSLPDGTIAGAVTTPHPTLRNATVEWAIEGDANADGHVQARYRKKGSNAWRLAMALRRVPAGSNEGFSWGNRHSGSIFGLEPGTTYEIELWLRDPDGGCAIERREVTTRPVPQPMAGARVVSVTPATLGAALSSAQPGDIIELGAGSYQSFVLQRDGSEGKPIVVRAKAGDTVTVAGTVDARSRQYVHVVGLQANRIRFGLSKRVTITHNTVTAVAQFDGIGAYKRAEDAYIADNVVSGPTTWNEAALGASGQNNGECILLTGPGHVVEHNKVSGCRDNISLLEDSEAVDQYSIDIIANDIDRAADDGVEADFCAHNCRVIGNRFTNVFIAMSSQPGLGGPTYFIRNVVYSNVYIAAFKLYRGSVGDVVLHNTIVKQGDALAITAGRAHARQLFRNNLFIGGPGGTFNGWSSGSGRVVWLPDAASDGSYDYDGFGSTNSNNSGRIGSTTFSSFAELRSKTSEAHAVQVDLGVFAATIALPQSPFPAKAPQDLRLRAGSAAVDVGEVIANVNDGYAGAAPDLGALEQGAAAPSYGPR
ncbi:MAG: right-handed parallel beta-helix repeat-containing protein [Myxococcales bacterium]|nr:right-handed parallel beta-helix repeat-containing protein [Myxococcales bacterium]